MQQIKGGRRKVSRNRSLMIYFASVLIFVAPKLFGCYQTTNMPSDYDRWMFIVPTDVLPFLVISAWAWFSPNAATLPTKSASHAGDPLLTFRFVACLMVIFGHYFGVVFPDQDPLSLAIPSSGFSCPLPGLVSGCSSRCRDT
jgi:hypothetical protein